MRFIITFFLSNLHPPYKKNGKRWFQNFKHKSLFPLVSEFCHRIENIPCHSPSFLNSKYLILLSSSLYNISFANKSVFNPIRLILFPFVPTYSALRPSENFRKTKLLTKLFNNSISPCIHIKSPNLQEKNLCPQNQRNHGNVAKVVMNRLAQTSIMFLSVYIVEKINFLKNILLEHYLY